MKLLALAVLGLGIALSYVAATSRFGPNRAASAAPKSAPAGETGNPYKFDRTVLPIPEPNLPTITELDARNAKAPPRFEVKAPAGCTERAHRADRRHGLRPVERLRRADPHADAASGWRKGGLRYNQFHTTALCSPTRAALLTGRNHHVVQHGLDHGDGDRLPRPDRAAAEQRRAAGRDAAAQRLQHRRLRQVARDRRLGSQPVRPDRPLADPLGLRQVLRLHRRRDQPVGPAHLRRHDHGRAAATTRTTTS